MSSKNTCFCGAKSAFEQCCQPFINKEKSPENPEQLMRSRFSAYASEKYEYIFDTYAVQSQANLFVHDIQESSEGTLWLALVIHSNKRTTAVMNNSEQFVEFSAFYIVDNKLCEMREKSRFVLETTDSQENIKQWRYVDGDIIEHSELEQLSRNQLCPCHNYPTAWPNKKGKKYKQCCGK